MLTTIMLKSIFIFAILHVKFILPCTERAICEWFWIPSKWCGKWYCYGVYNPIKPHWRNYWGVTHVCEDNWKGSHAISLHCKAESDWARRVFGVYYMGLIIPESLPWNASSFRWTDGSPLNFTDWSPPGHGSPHQQPYNDVPGQVERLVAHRDGWHDTIADPNIISLPCKKEPVRIERTNCPTTTTSTTTKTTTASTTQVPIGMETIHMDNIPTVKNPKPTGTKATAEPQKSCRVK